MSQEEYQDSVRTRGGTVENGYVRDAYVGHPQRRYVAAGGAAGDFKAKPRMFEHPSYAATKEN